MDGRAMSSTVCLYHSSSVSVAAPRQALLCVSRVARGWSVDARRQPDERVDLSNLNAGEVRAFADLLALLDGEGDPPPTLLLDRVTELLRPVHMMDCPGLWKLLLGHLGRHPEVTAMKVLDAMPDVAPDTWATPALLTACFRHAVAELEAEAPSPWSDRLAQRILHHTISSASFVFHDETPSYHGTTVAGAVTGTCRFVRAPGSVKLTTA